MEYKNVVVLEDEESSLLLLEKRLQQMGFQILSAFASAEEFIKKQGDLDFNILIVDIMLAGDLTGIDAVKSLEHKEDICVIYLTSNAREDLINQAKETLPEAFLEKPFSAMQLQSTLDISIHRFTEKRTQQKKLLKQHEMNQLQIGELMETQQHLITATWRERELKEELQKTKALIEEQNKKIMDSINYAKRIQKAIIPEHAALQKALGNYFMYYRPKDVVSGDFPWLYERDEYTYIAAVDCTGHGVPGAMMSLIGHLLLNDIVHNTAHIKSPGEVLNELHQAVVQTLKQDAPGNKAADGMDIALCRIKKDRSELIYAGAHRPLYVQKEGYEEIVQYKGSKYPIGGMQYNGQNSFDDEVVDIQKGDRIYFFSDGLPDQFGGPRNLKLGPKKIRQCIEENPGKSMPEMHEIFEMLFTKWMGSQKQMDDVLLFGIEI
ncbi:MAG: SpoIIE family protein phosphatase [Luteibaculum sp.]